MSEFTRLYPIFRLNLDKNIEITMKLKGDIDEEDLMIGISDMVSNVTGRYPHYIFLGVFLVLVLLILTSFCGSAMAIYCCNHCHIRRLCRPAALKRKQRSEKPQPKDSAEEAFV